MPARLSRRTADQLDERRRDRQHDGGNRRRRLGHGDDARQLVLDGAGVAGTQIAASATGRNRGRAAR